MIFVENDTTNDTTNTAENVTKKEEPALPK